MPKRFGPFDDLVRQLENIAIFSKQFEDTDFDVAVRENARQKAMGRIHTQLIAAAELAVNSIEEFQYGPLKERFMENIRKPDHVYVTHDLVVARVFNPKVGGTIQDLESGLYQSGASHAQRFAVWKFGIYLPHRYATERAKKYEKLPTYTEVIDERLEAWGDKAPYWVFIEYGNQGGDEAFPTFQGTGFIAQVTGKADSILQQAIDEAGKELAAGLDQAVIEQLSRPTTIIRTELRRIDVNQTPEGKLRQIAVKESIAGAYYQWVIGGKFARKLTPGEISTYIG